jgi:hypothetical protein
MDLRALDLGGGNLILDINALAGPPSPPGDGYGAATST